MLRDPNRKIKILLELKKMKMIDITLQHMTGIIITCIVLQNLCTLSKHNFDREWIEETKYILKRHDHMSLREIQKQW